MTRRSAVMPEPAGRHERVARTSGEWVDSVRCWGLSAALCCPEESCPLFLGVIVRRSLQCSYGDFGVHSVSVPSYFVVVGSFSDDKWSLS